jgi:hypothetical protein
MLLTLLGYAAISTIVEAARHSARGSGKTAGGASLTLRASGGNRQPSGRISVEFTSCFDVVGREDCRDVDGRRAVLSGQRRADGCIRLGLRLLTSHLYTPCNESLSNDDGLVSAPNNAARLRSVEPGRAPCCVRRRS